jgi:hypothetical protein
MHHFLAPPPTLHAGKRAFSEGGEPASYFPYYYVVAAVVAMLAVTMVVAVAG